ncbi:ketosteroid isomerase-like protein [Flavobacterium arsenatis]|uniref:Ketosteroid isomerase-like protein n=1 Tax=Flavobacterium arsenatis TaxID=1484332 RepID=A0ABU1TNV2_9FLAO|nr:nuclear transport factor 2 family protein [Flavobacterium arsenatis]MDR6967548.1 ketosteroid isomerase-like protein [Flavobacterium arsenatis]
MNQKQHLIEEFYAGFAEGNAKTMASCYHKDIQFQDPAFGKLEGQDVLDMWEMLIEKSKGNLKIEFSDVTADEFSGSAKWVATYNFSKTNRDVVNVIKASFVFKDGLIIKHTDHFDIWKWSKQALGLPGYLLGWTDFMQQKIQMNAIHSLRRYQSQKK